MEKQVINIGDIRREIKIVYTELDSYRKMLQKVKEKLVDWRQYSWPNRIKTNEVIRLEQSEKNLETGIDSLQKKLVQLNNSIK